MLQKLTALVARHPAVVVVGVAIAVATTAAVVGDTTAAVDATPTLAENRTFEPMDGVGGTGPPEVGGGDGS